MKRLRYTLSAVVSIGGLLATYACTDDPGDHTLTAPVPFAADVATDVVLVGAANIAACYNNFDEATALLLDQIPGTVVALGDNAFPNGRLTDYMSCYEPTWGRHKGRTYAVLGNHEYDMGNADGAVSAPATTSVTIGNLPPTVNVGEDRTIAAWRFTLRFTFNDPGTNDDPWRWTIFWGDGTTKSGKTSSQATTIEKSHLYVLPGEYRVRVRVTDRDGGVGEDELLLTVKLP